MDKLKSFTGLRKNLRKDFAGLRGVRVALLGDTGTQFLCEALRGAGFDGGLDVPIVAASPLGGPLGGSWDLNLSGTSETL